MIIRSVEYAGSIASPKNPFPGDLPQVAFSGRSNVGKSSVINTLLRRTRKKVAHVSSKPGKTQMLNFYRVNDRFFLVSWKRLVEWYLALPQPHGPRGVVHLVDGRHPPFKLDQEMMEYLGEIQLPAMVVLTKMDRIPKGKREKTLSTAAQGLSLDPEQLVAFSSKTGEGRESLLRALDDLLPPTQAGA